ncbi:MAG TPA: hypothetical protein DDW65_06815 [Firmicutes bacterium]|jgi:hypothetical protein|nr:hypothetical protein [Bacillota bacterium]
MKRWVFGFLLLLLCTGYGLVVKGMDDNITLTLTTDKKVYQPSQPITMSLEVLNRTSAPLNVTFVSSKAYDFILSSGEQIVWKWSEGRMYAQSLRTITLSPGKPLIYQSVFNPATAKKVLAEGSYKLVGVWPTMGKIYTSEPVYIEIRK